MQTPGSNSSRDLPRNFAGNLPGNRQIIFRYSFLVTHKNSDFNCAGFPSYSFRETHNKSDFNSAGFPNYSFLETHEKSDLNSAGSTKGEIVVPQYQFTPMGTNFSPPPQFGVHTREEDKKIAL